MAIDNIPFNTSLRLGAKARQTVDLLMMARDNISDLTATLSHMTDGADYTTIEQQLGIPAGQGANVLTLFGLVRDDLAASHVPELLARGG